MDTEGTKMNKQTDSLGPQGLTVQRETDGNQMFTVKCMEIALVINTSKVHDSKRVKQGSLL